MAARTRNITLQLTFDPVEGTKKLRFVAFNLDDDANSAISYEPTGSIPGARDLTAGELAGTLDSFLTSIQTQADALKP